MRISSMNENIGMTEKDFISLKKGMKVIAIFKELHESLPDIYPKAGTIGEVISKKEDDNMWIKVKWPEEANIKNNNISTILYFTVEVVNNDRDN